MRISVVFILLVSVACGEGTRLATDQRDFFSQENPFAPVLRILGDNPLILEVNTAFVDPGVSAQSLKDGDLSEQVQVQSNLDTSKVGQYQITYRVTDSESRSVSGVRVVLVIDTSFPVIRIGSLGASPSSDAGERVVRMSGDEVSHYKAVHLQGDSCTSVSFSEIAEVRLSESFRFEPSQGNNIVCAIGRDSSGNWQPTPSSSPVLFVDSLPPSVEINNADLGPNPSFSTASRMVQIFDAENDAVQYKAVSLQASSCSTANFDGVSARDINQPFEFNVEIGLNIICAIGIDALNNVQSVPTASAVLEIRSTGILIDLGRPSPTRNNSMVSAVLSGEGVDFYRAVHRTANNCNGVSFSGIAERPITQTFDFNPAEGNNILCAVGRNAGGEYSNNPSDVGFAFLFVDSIVPVVSVNSAGLGSSPSNNLSPRSLQITSPHPDVTHYKAMAFDDRSTCNGVNLTNAPARPIGESFSFTPMAADSGIGNRDYIVCAKGTDSIGYDGSAAASNILVIDTVAPEIQLNGSANMELDLCGVYEEQGAQIRDLRNGTYQNLGPAQVTGGVDSLTPDAYEIFYNGSDAAGNAASEVKRDVTINGLISGTTYQKGIATRAGLEGISTELGWNYLLCNDLNLNAETITPIGSETEAFAGILEGNDNSIRGLRIEGSSDFRGLFAATSSRAHLRNLQLVDVDVRGRSRVGSLVGSNHGMIENVHVLSGSVSHVNGGGQKRHLGGLVGENFGSIVNSSSAASIEGSDNFGGLLGTNRSTGVVSESFSTSDLTADSDDTNAGGLVGRNEGNEESSGAILKSFATGDILGGEDSSRLGGLVGLNEGRIEDSYAEGSVSGKDKVGGLIGEMRSSDGSSPVLTRSYALGVNGVSGQTDVGGLIGRNDAFDSVTASYWNVTTSGIGDPLFPPIESQYGTPKDDADMKMQITFAGWDFLNIWSIEEGIDYPRLQW